MELGFIKLHRKLKNNEIMYKDGILQLFVYLLLSANYKENVWCGITIKPGQLVTGKYRLSTILKTKPSTIYKRLQWLKSRNIIGIKSNYQYSIVTICNWETYQVDEIKEELQGNYKGTTKELQGNTLKEVKKERKKEKDINNIHLIYTEYPGKCPVKGSSTGKCSKNKTQIENLLKKHKPEYLIDLIRKYINDCIDSTRYIKNFTTFLNQLPDPEQFKDSSEGDKLRYEVE